MSPLTIHSELAVQPVLCAAVAVGMRFPTAAHHQTTILTMTIDPRARLAHLKAQARGTGWLIAVFDVLVFNDAVFASATANQQSSCSAFLLIPLLDLL